MADMALNRLEWTQKEQFIEYHVLKWPTSHLHPRTRTTGSAEFELKEQAGGSRASGGTAAEPEGIGSGLADRLNDSRWRRGGTGLDGVVQEGSREAAQNRDGMVLSTHQAGRQISGTDNETASAAVQSASAQLAAVQTIVQDAVYSAAYRSSVVQTVRKAGGRMREIIGRLRDIYQRQQKKEIPVKSSRAAQQKKERQGTRQVSRDEVLVMQAKNHYLLDSYDRNGQYSTLGKGKS